MAEPGGAAGRRRRLKGIEPLRRLTGWIDGSLASTLGMRLVTASSIELQRAWFDRLF